MLSCGPRELFSGWEGRALCGVGPESGTGLCQQLGITGPHSVMGGGLVLGEKAQLEHPEVQASGLHICISYSRSGPECVCVCVSPTLTFLILWLSL